MISGIQYSASVSQVHITQLIYHLPSTEMTSLEAVAKDNPFPQEGALIAQQIKKTTQELVEVARVSVSCSKTHTH